MKKYFFFGLLTALLVITPVSAQYSMPHKPFHWGTVFGPYSAYISDEEIITDMMLGFPFLFKAENVLQPLFFGIIPWLGYSGALTGEDGRFSFAMMDWKARLDFLGLVYFEDTIFGISIPLVQLTRRDTTNIYGESDEFIITSLATEPGLNFLVGSSGDSLSYKGKRSRIFCLASFGTFIDVASARPFVRIGALMGQLY